MKRFSGLFSKRPAFNRRLSAQKRILALFAFAVSLALAACSGSGSSDSGRTASSSNSKSPITSGAYKLDLDVGLVLCSDGEQYPQGFGSVVDVAVDFPLLSLFKNGEKIGIGHVDADGVFHANASYTSVGIRYDITLDGTAAKSQITGEASAAVTPPIGAQCTLNTRFTAKQGGA